MPLARAALYAGTAAAIILAVRSLVIEPLPLAVSAFAAAVYVALFTIGVLVLRLRVFVDAIVQGPRDARGVALTFDDGPDPVATRAVLDALDRAKARATFFVIAKKAERHPEVIREILARGHGVGLHSYAHDRLFSLRSARRVKEDLVRGIGVLTELTGARPTLFRPPIGHTNPTIARVAAELGLAVVGWSVGGGDGLASADEDRVVRRVRRGLKDGAIVLLHDAAERDDHAPIGARALPRVLEAIAERRLTVVPLEPWIDGA